MYLNLTNGLEFLTAFVDSCEDNDTAVPFKVVRIPSTWLEQHRYELLLSELDSDLLLHLALGDTCVIFDCGSRINKVDTDDFPSRAQWFGVPLIKYILERRWFGKNPTEVYVKKQNVVKLFQEIYKRVLTEHIKGKLDYFKKFVPEGNTEVKLDYKSKRSMHDSDYKWYADIAQSTL